MFKIVFENKELEEKLLEALNKGYNNLSIEDKEHLGKAIKKECSTLFTPLYTDEKKEYYCNVLNGEAREKYIGLVNIINNIYSDEIERIEKESFKFEIEKMLNEEDYDSIVIFHASFGWEIELKQRPQHLAEAMADKKVLYIYKTNAKHDRIFSLEKIKTNLYIMNFENKILNKILFEALKKRDDVRKFVHVYATCLYDVTYDMINEYMKLGFNVLYDFVDELTEVISCREITEYMLESHKKLLKDKDRVLVISTANRLKEISEEIRGSNKGIVLAPNGVNLDDFDNSLRGEPGEKIKTILQKKKTIIGYYGALASWFDYDLIKKLARERPQYEIVLIGINYDGTLDKSGILNIPNVNYLGIIHYRELIRNYANYFDVSLIPFVKNEITNSTSPIKLFEYMALGKPIVTTNIDECKKYKSSIVSYSNDEFIENVDNAIDLRDNNGYNELLKKEAFNNTWLNRAESIKNEMLKLN